MRILVVSQAKRGVKHVLSNVLPRLTDQGTEITYFTIPTNEAPSGCDRIEILDEGLLRRIESTSIPYLTYGVLFFWIRAHHFLSSKAADYDVVWLHNPRLLPITPKKIQKKLLITFHNHLLNKKASHREILGSTYYRFFGGIECHGITRLPNARFTVVNKEVVKQLERCGVDSNQIRYIGNGVDVQRFRPERGSGVRNRLDLPNGPLLLFLGRIASQKRPLALLRTFAEIREHREDVTLAIAGDGPMRDRAEQFVERRDIDGVHFLGFVDEELKPDLYAGSDYFVLPSSYEGEPLVIYEALASGLPCIVADIPNLEFLDHRDCGLVTEFGNPKRAASDIISYLTSINEHATNAREYAVENLDWRPKTDAYSRELQDVLQSSNQRNNG